MDWIPCKFEVRLYSKFFPLVPPAECLSFTVWNDVCAQSDTIEDKVSLCSVCIRSLEGLTTGIICDITDILVNFHRCDVETWGLTLHTHRLDTCCPAGTFKKEENLHSYRLWNISEVKRAGVFLGPEWTESSFFFLFFYTCLICSVNMCLLLLYSRTEQYQTFPTHYDTVTF